MILRRVIAHFRKQEWTAIGLDFLIVVLGVFIGIQVANWNTERQDRSDEKRLVQQLRGEVAAMIDDRNAWITEHTEVWQSFAGAVAIMQSEEETGLLSEAQCEAVWSSHIIVFSTSPLPTLDEITQTGALGKLDSADLRNLLLQFKVSQNQLLSQFSFIRTDYANLVDTHADAFPRRMTSEPDMSGDPFARLPFENDVACQLDIMRTDQTLRNKIVSNLARTTAVIQLAARERDLLTQLAEVLEERHS